MSSRRALKDCFKLLGKRETSLQILLLNEVGGASERLFIQPFILHCINLTSLKFTFTSTLFSVAAQSKLNV